MKDEPEKEALVVPFWVFAGVILLAVYGAVTLVTAARHKTCVESVQ